MMNIESDGNPNGNPSPFNALRRFGFAASLGLLPEVVNSHFGSKSLGIRRISGSWSFWGGGMVSGGGGTGCFGAGRGIFWNAKIGGRQNGGWKKGKRGNWNF